MRMKGKCSNYLSNRPHSSTSLEATGITVYTNTACKWCDRLNQGCSGHASNRNARSSLSLWVTRCPLREVGEESLREELIGLLLRSIYCGVRDEGLVLRYPQPSVEHHSDEGSEHLGHLAGRMYEVQYKNRSSSKPGALVLLKH